jgi:hypothetical protein
VVAVSLAFGEIDDFYIDYSTKFIKWT